MVLWRVLSFRVPWDGGRRCCGVRVLGCCGVRMLWCCGVKMLWCCGVRYIKIGVD